MFTLLPPPPSPFYASDRTQATLHTKGRTDGRRERVGDGMRMEIAMDEFRVALYSGTVIIPIGCLVRKTVNKVLKILLRIRPSKIHGMHMDGMHEQRVYFVSEHCISTLCDWIPKYPCYAYDPGQQVTN